MIGFIGCVLACRKIPGKSARKDWRNNLELILILALTLAWCSRLSPGSPYRKEIKAVDRMSETPKQAFTKSIGTVSILLKAGDLLLFGSSSCTKSNSRPLVGGVSGAKKLARTATVHTCISPQVLDMTGADCTPRHFASFMESEEEPNKETKGARQIYAVSRAAVHERKSRGSLSRS
jgi:hypothetical protein